jgi:hypothetical protein
MNIRQSFVFQTLPNCRIHCVAVGQGGEKSWSIPENSPKDVAHSRIVKYVTNSKFRLPSI